jgi:hypothetical protein
MSAGSITSFKADLPREEASSVFLPVLHQDVVDTRSLLLLVGGSKNREPGYTSAFTRKKAHGSYSPTIAQTPSFSRMWSEPVPKDSSPQMESRPASIRLPKNFPGCQLVHLAQKVYSSLHPVGTSKHSRPLSLATISIAPEVGIDLANPLTPPLK